MNVVAWQASVDARVLVALADVADDQPIDALRVAAGVSMDDLRASMRRLALRKTEAPAGSAAA